METKIFVELEENVDRDPMLPMVMNLAQIGAGVELRQGVVLNVSSEEVAQAVERILKAACRPHQVIRPQALKPVIEVRVVGTEKMSEKIAAAKEMVVQMINDGRALQKAGDSLFHAPAVAVEGPADTEAMEQLVAAVSGEESAVDNRPICKECQKPFTPTSNRPQLYCSDPACKRARQTRYVRESQARKKKAPSEADLREAEAIVEQLKPEIEAFGPGDAVDQDAQAKQEVGASEAVAEEAVAEEAVAEEAVQVLVDLPEPKTEVEAAEDFREKVWHVEDGPRAGRDFSASQLRELLLKGNMRSDQHLLHRRDGRHEVVKVPGKQFQKLKKCFGQNAGLVVSA